MNRDHAFGGNAHEKAMIAIGEWDRWLFA